MNTTAKMLIGATIGGAFGYFVGAVIVEIIALKENPDLYEEVEFKQLEKVEEDEGVPAGVHLIKNPKGKTVKTTRNYSEYFKDRPELAALAAKYNGESETIKPGEQEEIESGVEIEEMGLAGPQDDDLPEISIVSMEEFANAEGFQTMTLNYYDDDVVTDEHDNPIDRPERILGEESLVSFGMMSNDEDVVYVRNVPKNCMYEVVRTNKDYAAPLPRRSRQALSKRAAEKEDGDGEDKP